MAREAIVEAYQLILSSSMLVRTLPTEMGVSLPLRVACWDYSHLAGVSLQGLGHESHQIAARRRGMTSASSGK